MIDTNKYEGHTEGEWKFFGDDKWGYWVETPKHDDPMAFIERRNDDGQVVSLSKADALLIADAPLLLEEVLRLERELDTQYEYIEWLEEFAPKAEDYNTTWDAYELAKGIHWTQVEEEE